MGKQTWKLTERPGGNSYLRNIAEKILKDREIQNYP
jgi:hypothetical protein